MEPGYTKQRNAVWSAKFSLPYDDPKRKHCEPFNYVKIEDNGKYIGLFRIIPSLTNFDDQKIVSYTLEHVLSTLLDDVLFLYHQLSNWTTKEVLQYIIDKQSTKNWKLGTVAFTRYFHYSWENENLLSALFSVPKPFDVQYRWTWDTTSYPWTLNLVEDTTKSEGVLRYAHNMKELEVESDPTTVVNRIYPLGYGEGVNQLTIKKVNNNVPYLEDTESIAKYGLKQYIWVDKKFEDATSLKASAQGLLNQWKKPKLTGRATAANVSKITGLKKDELTEGKIITLIHPDYGIDEQRIVKEEHPDFKGRPQDVNLEWASKTEDLSTTTTDLERRQQINELYSNGATNIDSYQYNDNCDNQNPATIRFYFPEELVRINTCKLSYETSNFRAYERATKGGGAVVSSTSAGGAIVKSTSSGGATTATSSAGGATTTTSSSGGGVSKSTSSGGGTTTSSGGGGGWEGMTTLQQEVESGIAEEAWPRTQSTYGADSHRHSIFPHQHRVGLPDHNHTVQIPSHSHEFNTPNHQHEITISNHSHTVSIPNHQHEIDIPAHVHSITLPDHNHDLEYGIFEFDKMPTKHTIKVDGATIPITALSGDDINLIPYLSKDGDGKVNRGWHTLEIIPNQLARVTANIVSQFFIRSQGGGDF